MSLEVVATLAMIGVSLVLFGHSLPRCPECGSIQLARAWFGIPIWICERCDNVFRVR